MNAAERARLARALKSDPEHVADLRILVDPLKRMALKWSVSTAIAIVLSVLLLLSLPSPYSFVGFVLGLARAIYTAVHFIVVATSVRKCGEPGAELHDEVFDSMSKPLGVVSVEASEAAKRCAERIRLIRGQADER
jgi:hypothetical protein